jgi:hypothetical protein
MSENLEDRGKRFENDDETAAAEDVEAHVKHKGANDEGKADDESNDVEAHVKHKL